MTELEKLADEMLEAVSKLVNFIFDAPNASVRGATGEAAIRELDNIVSIDNESTSKAEFIASPVETASKWVALARAVSVSGRYNHDRLYKLKVAVENVLGKARNYVRFGTVKSMLRDFEVEQVRAGKVDFGNVVSTYAKRSSICRSCAGVIKKGEPALSFYWDFVGSGSWTAGACMMHGRTCSVINQDS